MHGGLSRYSSSTSAAAPGTWPQNRYLPLEAQGTQKITLQTTEAYEMCSYDKL